MAMTRRFLSALGIEPDKVDEIISAHSETVDALKRQRDEYKADAEKLVNVQKELDQLKADPQDDGYKAKYESLKKEYDDYKQSIADKELEQKKSEKYAEILKEAGISDKRVGSVLKVSDVKSIALDKDGNVKDKSELIKKIKDEWSEFIVTENTKGAETNNPPENTGGGTLTKKEIMKIRDSEERQKAIAENHELFGF